MNWLNLTRRKDMEMNNVEIGEIPFGKKFLC